MEYEVTKEHFKQFNGSGGSGAVFIRYKID